jgi:hypothetical protein
MEMELFKDLNVEKKVLKPFQIEERIFFPVIEIITIEDENHFNSINISPIAFIVEENAHKYIISINRDEIDEDELFELLSLAPQYKK